MYHKRFRPRRHRDSFIIPSAIKRRRVWSSNLNIQLRKTQTRNTESLPVPATVVVADPRQSHDSEQISPATIAHHTVYESIQKLQQNNVCQRRAHLYLVGPLSRLVGRPHFEPRLSKGVSPLITAANVPYGAISLAQTFNRILFYEMFY